MTFSRYFKVCILPTGLAAVLWLPACDAEKCSDAIYNAGNYTMLKCENGARGEFETHGVGTFLVCRCPGSSNATDGGAEAAPQ